MGLKLPEPARPKLRTHLAPALGAEKAKGQPGTAAGLLRRRNMTAEEGEGLDGGEMPDPRPLLLDANF